MLLLKRQMSKQHDELRNPIHTRFVLYYKVDFDLNALGLKIILNFKFKT